MASVGNDIQDLGVQIETIPGGLTGLCWPIDIGIGKPSKFRARSWQHGAYSYFPNGGQEETVEEQQQEDVQNEQEAESEEEGRSDMVVEEEEEQEEFISSSSSSSSGDENANNSFRPQRQAPRVDPPQREAPRRDPGWDDTSDSNYEPSSGDSSS